MNNLHAGEGRRTDSGYGVNSVCARIEEIFLEEGVTRARVDVAGRTRIVSLVLLIEAHVGDEVIVDGGVALSRIGEEEAVL